MGRLLRSLPEGVVELNGALFSSVFAWGFGALYGVTLYQALRLAPWRRLRDSEQLHVFLGAVICLTLLWHVRAEVNAGLSFHLLGVTAVTLMFGWSLGIVASSLALVGVTLNAGAGWDAYVLNAVLTGVVPVTLTQVLLVLIRFYLPKHFFVYVLVNGFLTAGAVGVVCGYLAAWMLIWSGAYTSVQLDQTLFPFFPLMFLPEAFLNGSITAAMVTFRPNWVGSFSDEQYLDGK
jgi:uncharacterized membrane protein